jgi:hypothetical protein
MIAERSSGANVGISRRQLVNAYAAAIGNSDAALFVGAGLSRESGYVDWKGLLRGCAEELGLDLDREYDLVAVAQYYLNLSAQNRYGLNRMLVDEFSRQGEFTENHRIIGRLPISTIWTTNFDTLIEKALDGAGRRVDVKSVDADIAIPKKRRDVVLYKMHGDIAHPGEIVISKADYERYARDHPVFQTSLEADLVAKTFLFLGFSFADPNLNYMLGHLNTLLEENQPQHFAIMRRARQSRALGDEGHAIFEYERNKQNLLIGELKRYGIRTHLIDRFSDVAEILCEIEEAALRKNVFVSGSAHQFADSFGDRRIGDLCERLGEALVKHENKLISGFGLNIGQSVVKGAVLKLHTQKDVGFEERIVLRPFPRDVPPDVSEPEFLAQYRRSIIAQCGYAVFISGTSRRSTVSEGVMEEYRIARELRKVPIPIGATGFAAEEIWKEIREDREEVYGGRVSAELYDRLNDSSLENEELVRAVFEVIERVSAN